MAFRKNYRKTKKRGGEEGANAVDKETRKYWKNYVNDILEKLESNQITFNIQELNDLIDIAIRYNVGEDLISRVAARGDRTTKRKFFDYEMSALKLRKLPKDEIEQKVKGGGKRRNTRRHKKKANQTHHKKHRRNSRKKHNTRRKYKL
jgi:hypothetical protein